MNVAWNALSNVKFYLIVLSAKQLKKIKKLVTARCK